LEDRIKAKVSRSRYVNMFGELLHANYVLLENATRQNSGYFYELMSCLVFTAFKYEAFINHLGYILFPNWNEWEREKNPDKQNAILTKLELPIDIGRRPFQTLHDLFNVRDSLAHGKPELLTDDSVTEYGSREQLRRKKPLTKWESLCTLKFAKRAYDDTEEIADLLWTSAGFNINDLRKRGHSYSISEIPRP
jgi:hypothetical protein